MAGVAICGQGPISYLREEMGLGLVFFSWLCRAASVSFLVSPRVDLLVPGVSIESLAEVCQFLVWCTLHQFENSRSHR